MICFLLYILNLKLKKATHFSHSRHQEVLLWSCPPETRESLKRPYFPLPLSILAGTNLIMLLLLLLLFCNPHLISGKIHSLLISEKIHAKPPKENQKNCIFFSHRVFWICSRGLVAFMPLDLNFNNPKSTIFELGWRTQPLLANHDQITK